MAYYDMNLRLGEYGQRWRELLRGLLAASGLHPRACVLDGGKPVPLAELIYWRKGSCVVVGLVKNPTRQGSISGADVIHGLTGKPIDVEIVFRMPVKDVRNLRTGKNLPAGKTTRAKWNPSEALLFEVTIVDG